MLRTITCISLSSIESTASVFSFKSSNLSFRIRSSFAVDVPRFKSVSSVTSSRGGGSGEERTCSSAVLELNGFIARSEEGEDRALTFSSAKAMMKTDVMIRHRHIFIYEYSAYHQKRRSE